MAATAGGVAVSARRELYPRGMLAVRALKLAQASLAGLSKLTVVEIQKRVADRYPDAELLPGRSQLDGVLQEVGLSLTWDDQLGSYVAPVQRAPASSTSIHREATRFIRRPMLPAKDLPPEIQKAWDFERRIQASAENPSYLVLHTTPKRLREAEREIRRRFSVDVVDVDAELIAAMRQQAEQIGADWSVVLRADAAKRDSRDWERLLMLVKRAMPTLEQRLTERSGPVLITYPGLLARYGQLSLLERLADGPMSHGLWVLVAGDSQTGRPTIDGEIVPARERIRRPKYRRLGSTISTGASRRAFID